MAKHKPSKTSARVIKGAERRITALELRRDGLSYREIAKQNGCTPSCAYSDVQKGLLHLAQRESDTAAKLRALEGERLTVAIGAIMPQVKQGNYDAISAFCRLIELESRLGGILSNGPDIAIGPVTVTLDWGETVPMPTQDIPDIITMELPRQLPAPVAEPQAAKPLTPVEKELERLNAVYGS